MAETFAGPVYHILFSVRVTHHDNPDPLDKQEIYYTGHTFSQIVAKYQHFSEMVEKVKKEKVD